MYESTELSVLFSVTSVVGPVCRWGGATHVFVGSQENLLYSSPTARLKNFNIYTDQSESWMKTLVLIITLLLC